MGLEYTGVVAGVPGLNLSGSPILPGLLADAAGWYDTKDSDSLKTDLLARFNSTNLTSLSIDNALQTGLDFGSDFSIAFWVKNDGSGGQYLVRKRANNSLGVWLQTTSGVHLQVNVKDGTNTANITELNALPIGVLTFVCVTYTQNGTLSLILNDDAPITTPGVPGAASNSSDFVVGALGASAYNGAMQYLGVWDRALTPTEYGSLWNSGTPSLSAFQAITTGGQALWPFWEPKGKRYDQWASNDLEDNNGVEADHGTVEVGAGDYAGITRLVDQSTSGSFGDLSSLGAGTAPVLLNGELVGDGLQQGLQTVGGVLTKPYTIVLRAKSSTSDITEKVLADIGQGAGQVQVYQDGGNTLLLNGFVGPIGSISPSNVETTWFFEAQTASASPFKVWLGTTPSSDEAEAPSGSLTGLTFLSNFAGTSGWDGEATAMILFDRALTSAERAAITSFLA